MSLPKVEEGKPVEDKYHSLAKQIQAEYELAWKHQKPKKDEALIRLKLYNNQRRDKEAVGDTTLFTIHQTVLASLYVDRLSVEFGGREEGDAEVAENLNAMAEYDYTDMQKDKLDYDWIWDTCFFGRGYMAEHEYERDPDNNIFLPLPEVLDPITLLRDPRATSINGDRNARGSARFFGREIKMTRQAIKDHPHIFNSDFRGIRIGSGTRSLLRDATEARDLAQGRQTQRMEGEKALGANAEYDLTEWHTHWDGQGKTKKVKVWLANERSKVIGLQILKSKNKRVFWPVIDRPLYQTAHDWDGVSIPDLVEDKQRARAVAVNLGLRGMKADLYPSYIYDSNKIINRNDLNFGFNKFIPVDSKGENLNTALLPMLKSRPNMQLFDFIMNTLLASAEKASATPELRQGMVSEEKRTLGEINLVASGSDTRYSLAAKIFGWSEKDFWRQWYWLHKEHFAEDIDEKVLYLEGALAPKWRPLKRKDIVARLDPHIKIESKVLTRAKQLEERVSLGQYFGLALQEPTANRRWGLKKLAKLNGLEKDEIDLLFPPTIDERLAEDENKSLSDNKFMPISREEDHNTHLIVNSKSADTNATTAHLEAHKKALSIRKVSPELFPEEPEAAAFQPPGTEKLLPLNSTREQRPVTPSQAPGQPVTP